MEQIAQLLRDRTGLVFPDARVRDVEATITRAMGQRGISDPNRLVEVLSTDDMILDTMIAELTIGETYFDRDPAQFEFLRSVVIPDILNARPAEEPVRIWSAGCASGEEPYTIAMLLVDMGVAARARILGTDISQQRIERARRGVYTRWSLRSMSDTDRDRWFKRRGNTYEIDPGLRRYTEFRYLNLASEALPVSLGGAGGMDLIMCRNVMIYFGQDTVRAVAERLMSSLSPDGWLILGASDPSIGELVDCEVIMTDAGVAYRRTRSPASSSERSLPLADIRSMSIDIDVTFELTTLPSDLVVDELPPVVQQTPEPVGAVRSVEAEVRDAYELRDYDAVRAIAADAARNEESVSPATWVAWVRALANQGHAREALAITERAHRRVSVAELHYLHAVLLLESDDAHAAADAARRALYLDRQLVMAHVTAAEAERRISDVHASTRSLRTAARLLQALAPNHPVPGSDGLSAQQVLDLVATRQRLLDTVSTS